MRNEKTMNGSGTGEACKRRGKSGRKERNERKREKDARTSCELSAGLRIKTRGEFESGKVLNDFRRSCLASWFIRKSQFAQRAGRTGEGGTEKEKRGGKGGRLSARELRPLGKVLQNYDVAFLLQERYLRFEKSASFQLPTPAPFLALSSRSSRDRFDIDGWKRKRTTSFSCDPDSF